MARRAPRGVPYGTVPKVEGVYSGVIPECEDRYAKRLASKSCRISRISRTRAPSRGCSPRKRRSPDWARAFKTSARTCQEGFRVVPRSTSEVREGSGEGKRMKRVKGMASHVKGFGSGASLGGEVSKYRNKENIYKQGAPAYTLFYIQEGGVRLTTKTKTQPAAVTAILGAGDFFGELCLAGYPLRMST